MGPPAAAARLADEVIREALRQVARPQRRFHVVRAHAAVAVSVQLREETFACKEFIMMKGCYSALESAMTSSVPTRPLLSRSSSVKSSGMRDRWLPCVMATALDSKIL